MRALPALVSSGGRAEASAPLRHLTSSRTFLVGLGLHVSLAVLLCFVPLLEGLGFERALATALLSALTSPALAITAQRNCRQSGGEPLRWWASAGLLGLILLAPSYLVGAILELATTPCDFESGGLFFLLLGGGNVVVGTSLGFAARSLIPSSRWAAVLVVAVLAGWLSAALVRLYGEPQVFVFATPLGYWPGSIYDEALEPNLALWGFRAFGVTLALSVTLIVRAFLSPRHLVSPTFLTLGAALAALAVWVHGFGSRLGFDLDRRDLIQTLATTVTTEHFVLHADPTLDQGAITRLGHEHEFAYQQLARFFGAAPKEPIHSFVYRDASQKGRLLGASRTQIARPWAAEIHIHGAESPHRVLKHELAHIFAGEISTGAFRIPFSLGLVPNIGLIEGAAVAADWPVRELTVHQWAAAMKRLERLPKVTESLDPTRFWSISSSRAYVSAGSFVRWLIDTRGLPGFIRLYQGASFEDAYRKPPDELETGWRSFLDAVELDDAALRMAQHRFSRPSIFEKTCARTAARLRDRAYQRVSSGNLAGARPLIERVFALRPSDPSPISALAHAYTRQGNLEAGEALALRAEGALGATEKARARGTEILGEIAWRRGDTARAQDIFERVMGLRLSTASQRLQSARLEALSRDAELQEELRSYLGGELASGQAIVRLGRLLRAQPEDGLIAYLYARRLEAVGAPEEAWHALEAAPPPIRPALREEARLTLGRLAFDAERYAVSAKAFEEAAQVSEQPALRAAAVEWAERARFMEARSLHRRE